MRYLILILVLAAVLRFWNLAGNPPGLTWDEAALGYNAYALLLTGKDEYGNLLPLTLKSFGDFKPALYAYLAIPFVAILGLNELAIRFPAALAGVLTVLMVYLLVLELFKNKSLAYFSAFFLAISPWHIQFTRPAFEASLALLLNLVGVFYFLKGVGKNKFFFLSALAFGLSLLTYQASKLFVPLIVGSLFVFYFKKFEIKKTKISVSILGLVLIIIIALSFFLNPGKRLSTLNFFAYQRSDEQVQIIKEEDGLEGLPFQLLHGEWWAYTRGLFERYLIYFSPKMLFIDGDYSQRHRVPDLGVLYYFSVILIPLGIIYFLKNNGKIVFAWLLLAPIPAVLSRDLISTLRSLNMVIPIVMLEAASLLVLINSLRNINKKIFWISLSLLLILLTLNFLIFLDRYFVHAPQEYSQYWLYGYKEALTKIDSKKYEKVIISDVYGQPYIYYLFYNKYSPKEFQKQAILDQPTVDVGTVRKIDNLEFRHIYWPSDRKQQRSLFLGSVDELPNKDIEPNEATIIKETNFLDGQPAFRFVETK